MEILKSLKVRKEQMNTARDTFDEIEKIREDRQPSMKKKKKTAKSKMATETGDDIDITFSYL